YTQINTFGSSSTLSVSSDRSHTTESTQLTQIDYIEGFLKLEGLALSNVPDPRAQAAGQVLDFLSGDNLWGSRSGHTTTGVVKENELTVISSDLQSAGITTDVNDGGPGIGDIIKGVINAR